MTSNLYVLHQNQEFNNKQVDNKRILKEFLGLSKVLAQKKRVRLMAQEQKKNLENRIFNLNKESKKAQKEVVQANKILKQEYQKRIRKERKINEKQHIKEANQKQLRKLKHASIFQRQQHRVNIAQALSNINQHNRYEYQISKNDQNQWHNLKKQFQTVISNEAKQKSLKIKQQHIKGSTRVLKFWKNKNKQHMKEYIQNIKKQEQLRSLNQNQSRYLTEKQSQLVDKLKYSQMHKFQLQQKAKQSTQLSLLQLQNSIMSTNKKRGSKNQKKRSISTMDYNNNPNTFSLKKLDLSRQSSLNQLNPYQGIVSVENQKGEKHVKKKRNRKKKSKI